MLSKRIEDGEPVDVIDLFDGLTRRMRELVEKGWDGSWDWRPRSLSVTTSVAVVKGFASGRCLAR
jgi:hypothetical protein